jgi:Mn2+/Fe2+ NRAMP family transporter
MVGVVTAVLTGSAAGMLAMIVSGYSGLAGFITGGVTGASVLVLLTRFQHSAWERALQRPLFDEEELDTS